MLNGKELRTFRTRRGLTIPNVAEYGGLAVSTISDVETGKLNVTEYNHRCIVDGINKAFFAKVNGTLKQTQKPKAHTKSIKGGGGK